MACGRYMRRSRVVALVLNILFFFLLGDLIVRLVTGHFLISIHLVHRVQRITSPWIERNEQSELLSRPNQANTLTRSYTHDLSKVEEIQNDDGTPKQHNKKICDELSSLEDCLEAVSHPKKELILIYTSQDLVHFSYNFVKVNQHVGNYIGSFLFVTDDAKVCAGLLKDNVPCWQYKDKTKSRGQCVHFAALEALRRNYTVQVIEYDVVLVWNTLCHLAEKCPRETCQAAASTKEKGKSYDGAIMYLNPSPGSVAFIECIANQYQRSKLQNKILGCSEKAWMVSHGFEVHKLPEQEYTRGHFHFHPSSLVKASCVNRNWDPVEAVYFMKESALWFMDDDDYFSASRKYVTYKNDWLKIFKDPSSVGKEKDALKNAFIVAEILNRTLILPKFHCWWYGYNCLVTMVASPNTIAKLPYRESSFLENPRVSPMLKTDQSQWYIVDNTETYTDHLISLDIFGQNNDRADGVVHLKAADIEHVTKEEVLQWFGGENSTLLRMVSTYGMDLCQGDKTISKVCSMF